MNVKSLNRAMKNAKPIESAKRTGGVIVCAKKPKAADGKHIAIFVSTDQADVCIQVLKRQRLSDKSSKVLQELCRKVSVAWMSSME